MTYRLKDPQNRLRLSTENSHEAFSKYRKLRAIGIAARLEVYESLWTRPVMIYEGDV